MMLSRGRHRMLTQCLAQRAKPLAGSEHFLLYGPNPEQDGSVQADDLIVVHHFNPPEIDNNIGYYVANELLPLLAGLHETHRLLPMEVAYDSSEQEIFERYVGEIVRSMDGNERRAWHLFYDNSLSALTGAASHAAGASPDQPEPETTSADSQQDFISNFGAIYQRALRLLDNTPCGPTGRLTVLDVATCFGFFPLLIVHRCAGKLAGVVGCDQNPALVNLANSYAWQRRLGKVRFVVADILATDHRGLVSPMAPFDAVTAIHLLEHLEPGQTQLAIANLWKLTGKRLIINVPLEKIPDSRFGHRQVFDRKRLSDIGRQLGGNHRYFEYCGGWIVVDRAPASNHPRRNAHHAEVSH